jgi:hypothetical protein
MRRLVSRKRKVVLKGGELAARKRHRDSAEERL